GKGGRCGGTGGGGPCRGRTATRRPATSPMTRGSLGGPYGVSTLTSSAVSRNSYSPEPPMTPMLARPATAGQATFEPEDEDDEESQEDDLPLPASSPCFLSLFLELSPEEESELEVLSDFLLSDPLADEAAGSFWLLRLSVR